MPYLLTHTYFGYCVLEKLGCRTGELNNPMFYLGCVGPDVYFFDRLPPTPFVPHQKALGNRMHNTDAGKLFSALLECRKSVHQAYIEGLVCHFALDASTHPYIESRYSGLDHTRFEVGIDMQTYREHSDKILLPTRRQQGADIKAIDELMSGAALKLYGENAPHSYERSCKKFLRIHRITHDPKGGKRRLLEPVERLFGKRGIISGFLLTEDLPDKEDCRNLKHRRWSSPWKPEHLRDESFIDLFNAGVSCALKLITLLRSDNEEAFIAELTGKSMDRGSL